ncbi:MAG: phage portal protein, partial [bacterium]|nr:phage portal protein [bacterium]
CDESYSENITDDRIIKVGKEFNRHTQLTAYHLFKDHPYDMYQIGDPYFRKRIPKKNVLHIGLAERLGQIRYKPFMTPILQKLQAYFEQPLESAYS